MSFAFHEVLDELGRASGQLVAGRRSRALEQAKVDCT